MPHVGPLQWALVLLLLILGCLLAVRAWRMAVKEPESEPRIEVLSGIGGGLVCGIAVGLSAIFMAESIRVSEEYATWRASVESAASIPGFTVAGRDIKGINFSGKSLHNADFTNADLRGAKFQDTDLTGADFTGADLREANLIGANLQDASLMNANLGNASLHSANLTHAVIAGPQTSFFGTKVNARTCWPKGPTPEQLNVLIIGVVVQKYTDDESGLTLTREDDKKDRVIGGQQAPGCALWKHGMRVHP
ncbi:pentapeptide repeat-containing protein [Streptomyces sp. WM6372]|uniref:pentapeptide repeat-containing protein n=1 Tax=Streptomyces sp. WM6372 TaxID=1415555 RepID=UPI00099D6F48|nr:pentapeptide repeat-containing protein [Streptomyces sp. WM6372]